MYYVKKTIEVSAAHRLALPYGSKCTSLHGHNWLITVECRAERLDPNGMVIDFTLLKRLIHDRMDHKVLNDVFPFNPTAENIARWVVDTIPGCYRCEVRESEGNTAAYQKD